MSSNNEQMTVIHKLELMIALEIKRICEENHINYFLTNGTLLGAVRHGGFIPWDDDMDIGMLREDYDKFLKVCEKELRPEFYLHTWDTDPEFPFSYAKVRLNGTCMEENFAMGTKLAHNGLFVDVFPFDSAPDSPRDRKRQSKKYFWCKRLLWIKKGFGKEMMQASTKQKVKYCTFWLIAHLTNYDSVKTYFKKTQIRYNSEKTEKVVMDGAYGYTKELIDSDWTTSLDKISFEGVEFLSFHKKEAYLEYLYGDYMQLPPVEQRIGHKIQKLDFGEYE